MQHSGVVAEKTEEVTETSSSQNSQSGDRDNISNLSGQERDSALHEMNEELASLLALYNKYTEDVGIIEMPEGREYLGARFLIVLPADKIGNSYSLRRLPNVTEQTGTDTGEDEGIQGERAPEKAS